MAELFPDRRIISKKVHVSSSLIKSLRCSGGIFKRSKIIMAQNYTFKTKKKRIFSIKRGVFGNLSRSHAFWKSQEKKVYDQVLTSQW